MKMIQGVKIVLEVVYGRISSGRRNLESLRLLEKFAIRCKAVDTRLGLSE